MRKRPLHLRKKVKQFFCGHSNIVDIDDMGKQIGRDPICQICFSLHYAPIDRQFALTQGGPLCLPSHQAKYGIKPKETEICNGQPDTGGVQETV